MPVTEGVAPEASPVCVGLWRYLDDMHHHILRISKIKRRRAQ